MIPEEIIDAFYTRNRTPEYPFAVNDVVTVRSGSRTGSRAWIVSLEEGNPDVAYLIEYDGGPSEIRGLNELEIQK